MRIRKHAKISPLLYAASSLKPGLHLQTHVCQLNQSPWDVMTFSPPSSPPPPFQVNGSDIRSGNGSSDHCVSVAREHSSRRRSEFPDATPKIEAAEDNTAPPPPPPPPLKNELPIMCCKTDGKSWQCRKEAAKGNSLCEHHLSSGKSYSNVAHHAAKKTVKLPPPPAEAPRRPRPKKAPAASSSNPYEFYYYSGFGPRWGKRRGEKSESNNNGGSSMPKNGGGDCAGAVADPPPAISRFDGEDFDYTEYEDDDDEEEFRDNGKKRVRKPIKARSLKSLL